MVHISSRACNANGGDSRTLHVSCNANGGDSHDMHISSRTCNATGGDPCSISSESLMHNSSMFSLGLCTEREDKSSKAEEKKKEDRYCSPAGHTPPTDRLTRETESAKLQRCQKATQRGYKKDSCKSNEVRDRVKSVKKVDWNKCDKKRRKSGLAQEQLNKSSHWSHLGPLFGAALLITALLVPVVARGASSLLRSGLKRKAQHAKSVLRNTRAWTRWLQTVMRCKETPCTNTDRQLGGRRPMRYTHLRAGSKEHNDAHRSSEVGVHRWDRWPEISILAGAYAL